MILSARYVAGTGKDHWHTYITAANLGQACGSVFV
jgi:hypothetical protein